MGAGVVLGLCVKEVSDFLCVHIIIRTCTEKCVLYRSINIPVTFLLYNCNVAINDQES